MPVVGADHQQDVITVRAPAVDRVDHQAGVAIRLAQHSEMLGRAERRVVLDVVGFAEPQDCERRAAARRTRRR